MYQNCVAPVLKFVYCKEAHQSVQVCKDHVYIYAKNMAIRNKLILLFWYFYSFEFKLIFNNAPAMEFEGI